MIKILPALAAALFCALYAPLVAQNISISYKIPDQLAVCSSDTLYITIQNNTAGPMSGAFIDLDLHPGLEYLPGSITGATDYDITNLQKPVLALPLLAPAVPLALQLRLSANCNLVPFINSDSLFSAGIRIRAGALHEELNTAKFQVQTSLLVITQVDNDSVSGEKDQVIIRTIHVQNTRLGDVKHLFLSDTHPAGISIHTPGAINEQNSPTQYTARFDGAFFQAFGNGDTLLDYDETVLLRQEITITDCGFPQFTCRSHIAAEWACAANDPPCQSDSTYADVVIVASSYQPKLTFKTKYTLPWEQCAQRPHEMSVQVVNEGPAPATNIIVQIRSEAPGALGMDKTGFRIRQHGTLAPITPSLTDDYPMPACNGIVKSAVVTLNLPEIGGYDTLNIFFDAYYCLGYGSCEQDLPKISLNYYHLKPCPPPPYNHAEADTVVFAANYNDRLNGFVLYNLGHCLDDGATYPFVYSLASNRFTADTGYLWLKFDLPYGLFWSDDCPPVLDGKSPVVFTIDSVFTKYPVNRVLMAFEMPFSNASLSMTFCLRNTCRDDASYVYTGAGADAAGNFFIYEPSSPACGDCGYDLLTTAYLTQLLTDDLNCAVPVCDSNRLLTVCQCPGGGGGGGGGGGSACFQTKEYHRAARLNYDLPDHDDDRKADPAGTPDLNKVRRDRFLPGDTMRNVFSTKIICGDSIGNLFYQLFAEVIRSDFGYAGNFDTIPIGPEQSGAARHYFTEKNMFEVVQATCTIWDSSANTVYSCPAPDLLLYEKLYGRVAKVNTKPPQISDELATTDYAFAPDMAAFGAKGCVPQGFLLEGGDSVALTVDLRFGRNYTPPCKQHFPPLVNFEMGYRANRGLNFYNYRQADTLMFQYSGYFDSLTNNTFAIKPCDTSVQVQPFLYEIRIARPNLFPCEVRPLSKITNYDLVIHPPDIIPRAARLDYLNLQSNIPFLPKMPLSFSFGNGVMHTDFSPVYQTPIDEGYQLRTSAVFEPNCEFVNPDSSAQYITLDFPGSMTTPDPKTYKLENKIGFYTNHPVDTITTDEAVLDFPTADIAVDVFVNNSALAASAPNFWIRLANPEGGLGNYGVSLQTPPGTAYTPVNGIFQLGKLDPKEIRNVHLTAVNHSCDPQHLQIIYGWNCDPFVDTAAYVCSMDTLEVLLRPQNPEIELELVEKPADIPLCDTSEYFVLELSDAYFGYAYRPLIDIELPAGFQLVPGSCQLAYPAGSAYQPFPDPLPAGGNVLEWNLAALVPAIDTSGLPGVNLAPQNALQIRFKVLTGCGVLSYQQLVFGARAEWYCGNPTNSLRKASDPLLVEGLAPAYGVQIFPSEPGVGPTPCNAERQLNLHFLLSGTTLPGDSIYVTLPPGYAYVAGSYQPGLNAPPGAPQIDGDLLRWPLPAGLGANASVQFSFKVFTGNIPNCNGATVRVQTRQRSAAFCPAINGDCTVYVTTGEAAYTLGVFNPEIVLSKAFGSINVQQNGVYTLQVGATGLLATTLTTVQIVRDVDGNGQLSAADTVVYVEHPGKLLVPGIVYDIAFISDHNPGDLCNLLVVLPAGDNCDCENTVFPLQADRISHANTSLCLGDSTLVGLPAQFGHSYAWSGTAGLPCTACSEFQFQPAAAGTYQLMLADSGAVCTVTHAFTVEVNDHPVLLTPNPSICQGQSTTLQTSAAASWNWQGPGIANPGAATQTVLPAQSATYFVTATNAAGCSLRDSVRVTVLSVSVNNQGVTTICAGARAEIFGDSTSTPGLYSDTLANAAGCDSILFLQLQVLPNILQEETRYRCPEDTLTLFGHLEVWEAGAYSESYSASNGCDSTQRVNVLDFPGPDLPETDTLYINYGDTAALTGPAGFATYLWWPADSLNCSACQSPLAWPADTTDYYLTVTTADGCKGVIVYRVVPRPPCDPARLRVPNAFTPDHDGHNDEFRVAPYEGSEVIARLRIFNRWGQKIYEGTGSNTGWDGTVDGKPAPSDVYVWLLEVLCDGVLGKPRKGDVTLLR